MIESVAIVGTGLIGASIGLALRRAGFSGKIVGMDTQRGGVRAGSCGWALSISFQQWLAGVAACRSADVMVLAVPVLAIMDWTQRLAPCWRPTS